MIYDHVGAIRDPFKQDLTPEFCRNQKATSILTETHTNHDQTHPTRNNWLGSIIFPTTDSHTKGMLLLLHLSLERITEVDTDPKERFVSFKVTPSNDRVLSLQGIESESSWLGGHFFDGLQSYTENKNKGNENKIILRGLNCTMDKINRDDENKTQRLYRCCSNYTMWKLIMGWGIYGEGRTQIPPSSPATIGSLARIQDRQGLYWYLYWYRNC